jgi:cobalt-zinc-cadmium efflux system outer membrane protein
MFYFCNGSQLWLRQSICIGSKSSTPFIEQSLPHRSRRRSAVPVFTGALMSILWASASLAAQAEHVSSALDLPQLIDIARKDNKDLQAACYAIDTARARLLQAGLRSNPRLDLSARSDFLFRNEGQYATTVGFSQQFPIAGRLSRQKDVARVDIALAETEVQEAERRLANSIAEAVGRLVVINRQIQSRDALIAVEEKLAKITRNRFKAAEVSELDVNTVQLDLQRFVQERNLLQTQRQALLVTLNTLLGRPASSTLNIDDSISETGSLPSLEQLQLKAIQSRPDLRSALLTSNRAEAEMALAKASRWEDWTVGLELSQDKQVITGAPAQGVDRAIGVTVSIPLPLFNKSQGLVAQAQASREQAEAKIFAQRLSIASEVAGAYGEATMLQTSLSQYGQRLLPISQRSVRLAQEGYNQGLIPVFDVVQAQRQQAELNATYLTTLDQYLQTLARLHTAVGDYIPASKNNEGRPTCGQ